MVMENPTPQCVGLEFVRQYYTIMHRSPMHLHRFYSTQSSFTHGGPNNKMEPAIGQNDIHKKIMSLNFHDCRAKIRLVDAHTTLDSGVVVQVSGELSNNGMPLRKFVQTFVLAPQSPKKYYVHNDIFRYQDEGFSDDETVDEGICEQEDTEKTHAIPPDSNHPSLQPTVNGISDHHSDTELASPQANSNWATETESWDAVESDHDVGWEESSSGPPQADKPADLDQNQDGHHSYRQQNNSSNERRNFASLFKEGGSGGYGPTGNIQLQATSNNHSSHQSHDLPPPKSSATNGSSTGSSYNTGGFTSRSIRGGQSRQMSRDRPYRNNDSEEPVDMFMEDRRRTNLPDSHQVFVGNLPHEISEEDLKNEFQRFGKIVEVRINLSKKQINVKGNSHPVPNFGFITFEDESAVITCLKSRPVQLNGTHRLNVEEKKVRTSMVSGGRPSSGRGGGMGGGSGMRQGPSQMGSMNQGNRMGGGGRGTGNYTRENRGGSLRGGTYQRRN